MPNHVKNKITIEANSEKLKEILLAIKSDYKCEDDEKDTYYFSFARIIPRPDGTNMDIEYNGLVSDLDYDSNRFSFDKPLSEHIKSLKEFVFNDDAFSDDRFSNYVTGLKNKILTGFATWYTWNIEFWGTKWDAYSQSNRGNILEFNTAWSHPREILVKLSEMFPETTFYVEYADEDIGSNFGKYVIKAGKRDKVEIENGIEFACELNGYNYQDYLKEMEE